MGAPQKLEYATPPVPQRKLHAVTRVLFGMLAMFFLAPTFDVITGEMHDGPWVDAIGIAVTLSMATVFGCISFTGRFRFWRRRGE
jgi:hypothetical protein